MKVFAIECRYLVPGNSPWLLWSGTHFYKTYEEAERRKDLLDHKHHPVKCEFRITPYGPCTSE